MDFSNRRFLNLFFWNFWLFDIVKTTVFNYFFYFFGHKMVGSVKRHFNNLKWNFTDNKLQAVARSLGGYEGVISLPSPTRTIIFFTKSFMFNDFFIDIGFFVNGILLLAAHIGVPIIDLGLNDTAKNL